MRIHVDSIPRTGRTVTLRQDEGWVRAAAAAALDVEPTSISGTLEISPPRRGKVEVHGTIEATAALSCDRCGETFSYALHTEPELRYLPGPETSSEEEVELAAEELEVGWYADGELDLGAVVQEAIALALPSRYTCTDVSACDARTEALLAASRPAEGGGHPGFAALKDLTN